MGVARYRMTALIGGHSATKNVGADFAIHRRGFQQSPVHSMIWSARNSSGGGIVSPSAFAVFKLMTSSNVVASASA